MNWPQEPAVTLLWRSDFAGCATQHNVSYEVRKHMIIIHTLYFCMFSLICWCMMPLHVALVNSASDGYYLFQFSVRAWKLKCAQRMVQWESHPSPHMLCLHQQLWPQNVTIILRFCLPCFLVFSAAEVNDSDSFRTCCLFSTKTSTSFSSTTSACQSKQAQEDRGRFYVFTTKNYLCFYVWLQIQTYQKPHSLVMKRVQWH